MKPLKPLRTRTIAYLLLVVFAVLLALSLQQPWGLNWWIAGWLCHSFFCDWEREP